MLKNTAGQKWRVFAFNRTTNQPVTGDAANITAKISGDYGAAVALADTNPTETEDGYYLFDLSQAETNYNDISIYPESSTSNVQVIGVPGNHQPETTDSYQVQYTVNTVPGRVSMYFTTDLAGLTRAESMSGIFRSDSAGVLTVDLAPGTYYVWPSKAGYTFTSPVAINVGVSPNSTTITGTASGSGYATTYAEYYGAVFPAEQNVVSGIEYTDGIEDWVGTAAAGLVPVVVSGRIVGPLIIGDDYLSANGRAFLFSVTKPSGTTGSTCTLRFVQAGGCTPATLEVTGTVVDADPNYTLTFDITSAQSSTLTAGEYFFFVILTTTTGKEITVVYSGQLVTWKDR